jgi:hypothetical protein
MNQQSNKKPTLLVPMVLTKMSPLTATLTTIHTASKFKLRDWDSKTNDPKLEKVSQKDLSGNANGLY